MRHLVTVFSLFIILVSYTLAQGTFQKGSEYCWHKKSNSPHSFILGDSPNSPKHKFDVLNYKIWMDIRHCFLSPYPRNYDANIIVKLRVDTALNSIDLNAVNTSLQIDSVSMAGVSFTHSSNILTITLNTMYNPNDTVDVKIYYRHLNVSDQAFYVSQNGNGMVFTDCEPQGARKWFPCWDRPSDKATVDITVKVPLSVRLGSNGRLNDSLVTGDSIYYHWISRDPVATYLTVLTGRVNYNLDIVYWHKISNPMDSVPIRFYWNTGESISSLNNIKTIIGPMTTYYSQKFGEHPFEKNGFATIASGSGFTWGGMENQTLTSLQYNSWSANLVSHEYAHQWFGDMITCASWADIWMNEGFATYCEALWYEYTGGYSSYKSDILSSANSYLSGNPGWAMYNASWAENPPNNNTLFNYAITYAKGACVLHMLRYLMGDSATFFNAIRAYSMDTVNFKHNSVATDDFAAKISESYGQDLTWFIDQWVKQPNHPVYQNFYQFIDNSGGNWTVGFQARQVQSNSPFHRMPLALRITFASGPDTIFRVDNNTNNQVWFWPFTRQPISFQFDPDNDIVLKQGTTTQGTVGITLQNEETPIHYALKQNYPNPFNPVTIIKFDLPRRSHVELRVYDVAGRLVAEIFNGLTEKGKYTAEFDASNISSGVYYYELIAQDLEKGGIFKEAKKMVIVR